MTPRHILLHQPHMATLSDHPELDMMSHGELHALEAFMGFCAEHCIGNPTAPDFRAFAHLRDQDPKSLLSLTAALTRLGIGTETLDETGLIFEERHHQAMFRGITKGRNRDYSRSVSVPVSELPADWQKTLRRLHLQQAFAPSILDRMERRLGMFARSAQKADRPVDLADTAALRALYEDMRARSIKRQREQAKKKGLDDNIDTPRWAYLRSSWEELRRFARAHGLPRGTWDKLTRTYSELVGLESKQEANKMAKAREAGTLTELRTAAEAILSKAEVEPRPHIRHALRNRAAAIALGCAVPSRPRDVYDNHVFGKGIVFEPERGAYRFRYTAMKTRFTTGQKINIPLLPEWNKFIDALVLQDQDPRYLGHLREKAIAEFRPLYVQYDGTPAAYAWYSRMWAMVAKTGGQIARTLVYDAALLEGEAGIQYGRAANGHAPNSPIVAKYRSERAAETLITLGQGIMAGLEGDQDDDISDLL